MNRPSIASPLRAEGLTTLQIRHDFRDGRMLALASREWSTEFRFEAYASSFDSESVLTTAPAVLSHEQTLAMFQRHGALERLQGLFDLIAAGRHQGVDVWVHPTRAIHVISNMHSNRLGIGNGRHAIRAGGIRRHGLDESEHGVLADGLNLARAMSYKNAAAQIDFGGSKICVVSDFIELDDWEALGFLGWCIDRSRCFTGPDMGFVPEHADALRSRFTRNIVGGPGGALGPTGDPTARGVLRAMQQAAAVHLDCGLEGLSVAVQGLGAVGGPLASGLLAEGVRSLLVADTDEGRERAFLSSHAGDGRIRVVPSDEILRADVDIVSPNAVGGVLDAAAIEALRCSIVMGGANNQLDAVSRDEELALADALDARGILYEIDWMHNTAGVIAGCEEWLHQQDALMRRVDEHLERVCGQGVRDNLERAKAADINPTRAAYAAMEALIYGSGGDERS